MQYVQVYNLPIWYCIHCKMITTISLANISHHVRVASVMSDSLWPHGLWPIRFLCPWDFSGKNTRVGCGALLQGIFPGQGPNFHLLYLLQWQAGSLPLMPPGKLLQSLNIVIKKNKTSRFSATVVNTDNAVFLPTEEPLLESSSSCICPACTPLQTWGAIPSHPVQGRPMSLTTWPLPQ